MTLLRYIDHNTGNPVFVRPLRSDELEKWHAEDGDYLVMNSGEVLVLSPEELNRRYSKPDAHGIHN